ncbi:UUP1 family membrane protein [Maridesulfovibrio sp.]|uniref:UUP1 family membrane protein n=1 Tax=Maridesulfovibrio sp. TaxID=2795000 RepID=UPI003BAC1B85
MKDKKQLLFLIAILFLLGFGLTAYKIIGLGFSLSPDEKTTVWTIEATITYEADGGPAEISLNLPDNHEGLVAVSEAYDTPGYSYEIVQKGKTRRGVWKAADVHGSQKVYARANIYRRDQGSGELVELEDYPGIPLIDTHKTAADLLIKEAKSTTGGHTILAQEILRLMNEPELNAHAARLYELKEEHGGALGLVRSVLYQAGLKAHVVKGTALNSKGKKKKLRTYLEVLDGSHWVLLDPVRGTVLNSDDFLLWQLDDESLLEVTGGTNSKVKFSSMQTKILANQAAINAGLGKQKSLFVDFSIYTLPIQAQNSFKLLLLIPFGALVVVVMRNLVGVRTSGTFLPILIALTFLQTSLLTGLILFILIVSVGLVLRSYLSHLNLLLVPRISAVLVFVIIIYLAISVISYKMGSDIGLLVTFFPMIIISWTIERMSILWEEEGPKEVLIQGGGSLLTASIVYLLLINRMIEHLTYSFPELLLVVLAIILSIGSYTGYRLSELRRFEPLGRE